MSNFDSNKFSSILKSKEIGQKLVCQDVTGSTMDDARRLAHDVSSYPHGTVVLAEIQTKARGARDHVWDASNTGNIYASIILHVSPQYQTFEGRFILEVAACLATLAAVKQKGVTSAQAKWPNDVWVRGHKLAGFLAEDGKFEVPGTVKCVMILGIGINVNADTRRSQELCSIATSMSCEKNGEIIDRESFFAELCLALEETLSVPKDVNLNNFRSQNLFQSGCCVNVTSSSTGSTKEATFTEICDNWDIKVQEVQTQCFIQGRSDELTVRPRASSFIKLVFCSSSLDKTQRLASQIQSCVNTAEIGVSLLAEAAVTESDWSKDCSLLIFTTEPTQPDAVKSRLQTFLTSGGRLLVVGEAAHFMAVNIGIKVSDAILPSCLLQPEVGLLPVFLQFDIPEVEEDKSLLESTGSSDNNSIIFPTNLYCFNFGDLTDFQDIKTGNSSSNQPAGDNESEMFWSSFMFEKVIACCSDESKSKISVVSLKCPQDGNIFLCGFDIGVFYPFMSKESDRPKDEKILILQELDLVKRHRFFRDRFFCELIEKAVGIK